MYGETCLSKKKKKTIFINGLNIGSPRGARVEKTVQVMETHRLSSKEKVQGAVLIKVGVEWLVDWVLGHISLCRLFNAKFIFMKIILFSNNSL